MEAWGQCCTGEPSCFRLLLGERIWNMLWLTLWLYMVIAQPVKAKNQGGNIDCDTRVKSQYNRYWLRISNCNGIKLADTCWLIPYSMKSGVSLSMSCDLAKDLDHYTKLVLITLLILPLWNLLIISIFFFSSLNVFKHIYVFLLICTV